ncbi:MAG: NAD(P)/FAD-dependent oxidoreductase [Candidatus Hydrogenedentota bacterium]
MEEETNSNQRHLRIAIFGAGASGLLAAIKLREMGLEDLTIFEKAGDLGGTWRENRYPGLSCDVPSHAYRYSFAPNPEWSHMCSPGHEIQAYLKDIAERYELENIIKYNNEVIRANFADGKWHLESVEGSQGSFDAVITATGLLHHPVYPDIPGLDDFDGPMFHTARWDDAATLEGKRVGIIGAGSTSVQITSAIVDQVSKLSIFQRTAQWIFPLPNTPISEEQKQSYRDDPLLMQEEYDRISHENNTKFAAAVVGENPRAYQKLFALCQENLECVRDPELRAKLTPDYEMGCKRLVMSDTFYEAIQHTNAELVTDDIELIEAGGIRTKDGRLHELDVLVLATGFDTHKPLGSMTVTGPDNYTLEEAWSQGNQGYMTTSVPGFPNWFMIGGPNSPIGNFSWLLTAETQFAYIAQLIEKLHIDGVATIVPTAKAATDFNNAVQAKIPDTIWATGCSSWYLDKHGRVGSWPWTFDEFQSKLSKPKWGDFELV